MCWSRQFGVFGGGSPGRADWMGFHMFPPWLPTVFGAPELIYGTTPTSAYERHDRACPDVATDRSRRNWGSSGLRCSGLPSGSSGPWSPVARFGNRSCLEAEIRRHRCCMCQPPGAFREPLPSRVPRRSEHRECHRRFQPPPGASWFRAKRANSKAADLPGGNGLNRIG